LGEFAAGHGTFGGVAGAGAGGTARLLKLIEEILATGLGIAASGTLTGILAGLLRLILRERALALLLTLLLVLRRLTFALLLALSLPLLALLARLLAALTFALLTFLGLLI